MTFSLLHSGGVAKKEVGELQINWRFHFYQPHQPFHQPPLPLLFLFALYAECLESSNTYTLSCAVFLLAIFIMDS